MISRNSAEVEIYEPGFGKSGVQKTHRVALEKFLNGEDHGLNVEIINTVPEKPLVWSIRYGIAGRMLLTLREMGDTKKWLVLEDLPTHDYDSAHFLKPHVLARFMNQLANANPVDEKIPAKIAARPLNKDEQNFLSKHNPKNKRNISLSPIISFDHELFPLDETQREASHTRLPLIIDGPAGSGKTCVAWNLLESLPEQVEDEVIYIAQNSNLVNKLKLEWLARPIKKESDNRVRFLTYEEYAKEIMPDLAHCVLVEKGEFNKWLDAQWQEHGFLRNWLNVAKDGEQTGLSHLKENIDKIYEELRILSGYEDNAYLNLGERESLFPKKYRNMIVKIRDHYATHLNDHHQADLALLKLEPSKQKKGALVIDEALDLSYGQINNLIKDSDQFCLCNGSLQNVKDRIPNRDYQDKRLYELHIKANPIKLKKIYRQGEELSLFGGFIAKILLFLRGGASNKKMPASLSASHSNKNGNVYILDQLTTEQFTAINHKYFKSDIAIIVAEKDKATAKELYQTPFIFTADEAIGLQFPCVILLDPLESDLFDIANKKLTAMNIESKDLEAGTHLAKNGEEDTRFDVALNKLYTAGTRCSKEMYVIQKPRHAIEKLLDLLMDAFKEKPKELNQPLKNEKSAAQIREEIEAKLQRAEQLLYNNNIEQVNAIRAELPEDDQQRLDRMIHSVKSQLAASHEAKQAERDSPPRTSPSSARSKPVRSTGNPKGSMIAHPQQPIPQITAGSAPLPELPNDKNFKPKQLKNFLAHEQAAEALFKQQLNKPDHFHSIINSDTKLKVLVEVLKENSLLIKSIPLSRLLCIVRVKVAEEIKSDPRSGKLVHSNRIYTGPCIGELARKPPLIELLKLLLAHQTIEDPKKLLQSLIMGCPITSASVAYTTSPLAMFFVNDEGLNTIDELFDKYALVNYFSQEDLYSAKYKSPLESDEKSYSLFQLMSQTAGTRRILKKLYSLNPELVKGLTAEQFYRSYHYIDESAAAADIRRVASPFANIISNDPNDLALTALILTKRPDLLHEAPAQALTTKLSHSYHDFFTVNQPRPSPIETLILNKETQELAYQWYKKNAEKVLAMATNNPTESQTLATKSLPDFFNVINFIQVFLFLSIHQEIHASLLKLFDIYPDGFSSIKDFINNPPRPTTRTEIERVLINNLKQSDAGKLILNKLPINENNSQSITDSENTLTTTLSNPTDSNRLFSHGVPQHLPTQLAAQLEADSSAPINSKYSTK